MLKMFAFSMAERLLNRIIDADPVLRQSLDSLAPATVNLCIASPSLQTSIALDHGRLRLYEGDSAGRTESLDTHGRPLSALSASPSVAGEVTVEVPHVAALLELFFNDGPGIGQYQARGDVQLLQKMKRAFLTAEPDIGLQLEPWIGPAAAGQIQQWLVRARHEAVRLGRSTDHYVDELLKEDLNLLPERWQLDSQMLQLQQLQTRLERLEARLDQYSSASAGTATDQASKSG